MDQNFETLSNIDSNFELGLGLEDIIMKSEKNLKSEVNKGIQKRRSQLVVISSSSEGSMKSSEFGSATLSSINNSATLSDPNSCRESHPTDQDVNPTLLDELDSSLLVDISEELISISNNSFISKKHIMEKLSRQKGLERSRNKSLILNKTMEINSELLSDEARRIIAYIDARSPLLLNAPNRSSAVLDLDENETKILMSTSSNDSFYDMKEEIENPTNYITEANLEKSTCERFLLFEAQKVLDALYKDNSKSCPTPLTKEMSVLDLEMLDDSLLNSSISDQKYKNNDVHANKNISASRITIENTAKLNFSTDKLLNEVDGQLKDLKLSSPFSHSDNKILETCQNTSFADNKEIDITKILTKLNNSFEISSRQEISNLKCINCTCSQTSFDCKDKETTKDIQLQNVNCTFNCADIKKKSSQEKAEMNDETFVQDAPFINTTFDHTNLIPRKDKKEDGNLHLTFSADNVKEDMNSTFEIVGNGMFIVGGEVTNLIDMESTALQTVLHSTPIADNNKKHAETPIFRRNSLCNVKKKQSFMNRLSLAGSLSSGTQDQICNKSYVCVENTNKGEIGSIYELNQHTSPCLKSEDPFCKEKLLIKLRKNTKLATGVAGPVKAIPFKAAAFSDRFNMKSERAISTPIRVLSNQNSELNSGEKNGSKFPSLPSFGSVSSIDERPSIYDGASEGSLGTPEVFRSQTVREGPAITSTPAMNSEVKLSMIPKGLDGNCVPTPIVAPKGIQKIKHSYSTDLHIQGVASANISCTAYEDADAHRNTFCDPCNLNIDGLEEDQFSTYINHPLNTNYLICDDKSSGLATVEKDNCLRSKLLINSAVSLIRETGLKENASTEEIKELECIVEADTVAVKCAEELCDNKKIKFTQFPSKQDATMEAVELMTPNYCASPLRKVESSGVIVCTESTYSNFRVDKEPFPVEQGISKDAVNSFTALVTKTEIPNTIVSIDPVIERSSNVSNTNDEMLDKLPVFFEQTKTEEAKHIIESAFSFPVKNSEILMSTVSDNIIDGIKTICNTDETNCVISSVLVEEAIVPMDKIPEIFDNTADKDRTMKISETKVKASSKKVVASIALGNIKNYQISTKEIKGTSDAFTDKVKLGNKNIERTQTFHKTNVTKQPLKHQMPTKANTKFIDMTTRQLNKGTHYSTPSTIIPSTKDIRNCENIKYVNDHAKENQTTSVNKGKSTSSTVRNLQRKEIPSTIQKSSCSVNKKRVTPVLQPSSITKIKTPTSVQEQLNGHTLKGSSTLKMPLPGMKVPLKISSTNILMPQESTVKITNGSRLSYVRTQSQLPSASTTNIKTASIIEKPTGSTKENVNPLSKNIQRPSGIRPPSTRIPKKF